MKQILQNLKSGETYIADVPIPSVGQGQILIRSVKTLISSGTERMLLDFGSAGYLRKAQQHPDKVREALNKIKTDGIKSTFEAIQNKLEQPIPLGYCNVGIVSKVGSGTAGFKEGDRVISNGAHAEFVCSHVNLAAKIPNNVTDEAAAFTVTGAIALQGIRLANPTLGETIAVVGLGLIGLLTLQLLKANGCRVIGIDVDPDRLKVAAIFGAETIDLSKSQNPVTITSEFTRGHGVDAVIITTSTKSGDPIHQAAQMCRKRGRIILVGVAGLDLSRADFFEKELTFQVSCSYGPGRYDANYEEKGNDYPIGFVRWTEQRNFEAVLDMMADGRLNAEPLISHKFNIDDAKDAYKLISKTNASLGVLLNYKNTSKHKTIETNNRINQQKVSVTGGIPRVGFIGAGQYALSKLIPAFRASGAYLALVASKNGVSGHHAMKKFKFSQNVTDSEALITDGLTDTIVIATRHNSHAQYVLSSLKAKKHVFVEKPLCLTKQELDKILRAYAHFDHADPTLSKPILMVGFNRRFAPHILKIKSLINDVQEPKSFVMTVNAGVIKSDHWTQDPNVGGGRIIGEVCHFVDLLRFLSGAKITNWQILTMDTKTQDTLSIQLAFADGSIGTIHYFSNGSKSLSKERLEVFSQGAVLQLDNFRKLTAHGWNNFKYKRLWQQDKGHNACVAAFINAIKQGGDAPIPFEEIVEVSKICIELAN